MRREISCWPELGFDHFSINGHTELDVNRLFLITVPRENFKFNFLWDFKLI